MLMTGPQLLNGEGLNEHIHSIMNGDSIESRLTLINQSNHLSDEGKEFQRYFLKSFCLMAAITPYCGKTLDLGDGVTLELGNPREELKDNEWPGTRVDQVGDWNVYGRYYKNGQFVYVNMPLLIRNAPVFGSGPWENFLEQAKFILKDIVR
jgi:hypothetical protein